MLQRSLPAILGFLAWATCMAHACSCVMLSDGHHCNTSWISDGTVFLGTVTAKTIIEDRPDSGGGARAFGSHYAFHFSDVEMFHGDPVKDGELVVHTGRGGGDCGYTFVVGSRYLVYASIRNGQLITGTCTQTSPEVTARGAIKELRSLRDNGRADDLFGVVTQGPKGADYEDLISSRPLSGVPIRLIGGRGEVFSTTTDADGVYSFSILPYGTYRIEHTLPAGLVSIEDSNEPVSVELSNQGGHGTGCTVDVVARANGVISGRVVDSNGNGLAGFVTIQPVDPDEAKFFLRHGGLSGDDTADGNFTLSRLQPGRYRLVFQPKDIDGMIDFWHKSYWPTGNNGAEPDAIELGLGQHVENVRFEVVRSAGKK